MPQASRTFSWSFSGKCRVAKGLILPHVHTVSVHTVAVGMYPREAVQGGCTYVYILHAVAHSSHAYPAAIFSTSSLSFSLSPCARALIAD